MKRITAAAMAAVMIAATLLSGCGNKNNADNGETVTLHWLLAGDKLTDTTMVWEEFNKRLPEKLPGTQVEFDIISFADYAEQWRLMAAANEKIDLAWNGWVLVFRDEVNKGAYMQIDDLLAQYAPKLKETIPQWVWKDQMIDGKLYSIPNYQKMVSTGSGLIFNEIKANKYLDKEALEAAFIENEEESYARNYTLGTHWNDKIWDILDDYMGKLQAAGELGLGFDPAILDWLPKNGLSDGYKYTAYAGKDENGRYVAKYNYEDADLNKKFFARMRDFYEKGYIRKDVLTATENDTDSDAEGGYAIRIHSADDFTQQTSNADAEKETDRVYICRTSQKAEPYGRVSDTNTVIPATAQNPERAMQLIEVINSTEDTELFNLLTYGLEGKHYEKIGENKVKKTNTKAYEMQAWTLGNAFNAWDTEATVEGYNDYVLNVLHNEENHVVKKDPKLSDFVFDDLPVKGNVAQVESVLKEFEGLRYGVYPDWEARYDALVAKLEKCGVQKIMDELQRQFDENLNK